MRLHCSACKCAKHQQLPPNATPRERAIFGLSEKWVSGTRLSYSFIGGTDAYQDALATAFREWEEWVDIRFDRLPTADTNGQIRISFVDGGGAWSYIGRDVLNVPMTEATMNIGWSPVADFDMALHEIGHTLALYHEHQNAGIDWNEEAVLEELSGPPNYWDEATIRHNVLRTVPPRTVIGNEIFDSDSIMMYDIPARWIETGPNAETGIHPSAGLSAADKYWATQVYPFLPDDPPVVVPSDPLAANIETDLVLSIGEQNRIRFAVPEDATYEMGTTGEADTVCVLFNNHTEEQVAADDDGGLDRNALITQPLEEGIIYELTTRLYYRESRATTAFIRRLN